MPRRVVIYPYKMGSRSAKSLARELGAIRVYPDKNYRPRPTDLIINWGNSKLPDWFNMCSGVVNDPDNVSAASNKLRSFIALRQGGVQVPEFTTDQSEAQRWLDADDGTKVVERHKLTGHSGNGAVIKEFGDDISPAPLYVKYVKKAKEFRVHIFNGHVIDVQEKRKRRELERDEVNFQIRNHQNGWVFCREDIEEPDNLREVSIRAVRSLGLDFGAVDVIYNQHHNQLYVLEINTACGLEGTTLESYTNAIRGVI